MEYCPYGGRARAMSNGNGVDRGSFSGVGLETYTKFVEFVYQKFSLSLICKKLVGVG